MDAIDFMHEKFKSGIGKRVALKDVLIRESDLADMLEEYHEAKLKLLNKRNVSNNASSTPISFFKGTGRYDAQGRQIL